ncbi:hypothetical protein BC628DRAFT_1376929 [Trametes gibbosa]|nr:hypothetical protein BC628DRAFT_1376929 [Trametes gibbosa]
MARFRCPSSSSLGSTRSQGSLATIVPTRPPPKRRYHKATVEDDESFVASPSNVRTAAYQAARVEEEPVMKRNKGKGKLRTRGSMDIRERERLRMAMKKLKAEVKPAVKLPVVKPVEAAWSFVFVGNLSSETNEAELKDYFSRCGPIRRIIMRASGGVCVPTATLKGGFLGFGGVKPSVHYATIEFSTGAGARAAIDLDKTEFYGRPIVVSFSAADLPEVSDVVKMSAARKKNPKIAKLPLWKEKLGQLKRLTIQRTEYVPDPASDARREGGMTAVMANVAVRVGLFAAGGSTAAGAHQTAARHGQIPLRQTLV